MTSKVLNSRAVNKEAKFVLLCFPWAGGGSNFYANWSKLVPAPDFLEVCGITLPGREARYREPCHNRLHEHIQEVCCAITEKYNGRRLAFWGHSMGALLAFQTALKLKQDKGLEPVRLFVSGISAPQSRKRKETKTGVDKMNDEEFKEYLRRLGGTPKEVLENKELMDLFLPSLRADYSLLDHFE
ncbi:hypothetical protein FSP39_011302 [Pinctada imbricata]|uniref:oleoyl-[acyl-carrier-protein] hydrolase n=1 Tax=Pinctada imbricata TaxID=66713 RepID=A0AA89C8S0_PINIB|nr:hypothetical protein FSP39_011302 [Pinctada imbricata]